ncbi:hypothetical protein ACF0H5_003944 [Mactra antiquata]
MAERIYLFLVLISSWSTSMVAETGTDVKNLLNVVLQVNEYSDKIRPVFDQTNSIVITIDFTLHSVVDFDDQRGILTTSCYLTIGWIDEYFTWKPRVHNGTTSVFVPQSVIWKPDISLKNSLESYEGLGSDNLNVQVYYDGYVVWNPYQVFTSTCAPSITYYPFDTQVCDLEFAMWSYSKNQVQLQIGDGTASDSYAGNALWELLEMANVEDDAERNSVAFRLTLKRKPRFVIINVILPVMLLSVINVFTFCLPVTSGERGAYAITSFLSLAVFFTIVSDQLPQNSENTSLLAVYLMSITALSTVNVIVSIIELRLFAWHDTDKPVGKLYRCFLAVSCFRRCEKFRKNRIKDNDKNNSVTCIKNLPPLSPDEIPSIPNLSGNDEETSQSPTWLDVVNAMDIIFFLFSLFFTISCNAVIIGIASVQ